MSKLVLAGSAGLLCLAFSTTPAFAGDPRFAGLDRSSLNTCESAIRNQLRPVEIRETFHDRDRDGGHVIYANVRMLEDGKLQPVRVTCETSVSGMRLKQLSTANGRWVEGLARGLSQN